MGDLESIGRDVCLAVWDLVDPKQEVVSQLLALEQGGIASIGAGADKAIAPAPVVVEEEAAPVETRRRFTMRRKKKGSSKL